MTASKIVLNAASGVGGAGLDVDEVFSTFLYEGNATSRSIVNGIDLADKGGLVWTKNRDDSYDHNFVDSARGLTNSPYIRSNTTGQQGTDGGGITQFNSNGYTMGNSGSWNANGNSHVSWTFAKAEKFFDVVTWDGNNTAGREIAHNLGTTVGTIIVKCTSRTSTAWTIYHRSSGSGKYLEFDTGAEGNAGTAYWNATEPTSSVFTLGNDGNVNATGRSYVAYLFAHNDGDGTFGPDGDADIIKCGSYTHPNDTSTVSVNLGFEPQWLLLKANQSSTNWYIFDVMRGIVTGGLSGDGDAALFPNTNGAENVNTHGIDVTPTGFDAAGNNIASSGNNVIYIAIRRGPLAPPTSATNVFDIKTSVNTNPGFTSDNVIDLAMITHKTTSDNRYWSTRLTSRGYLYSNATNAEATSNAWDFGGTQFGHYTSTGLGTNYLGYFWKRAPNFCDVVAYTAGSGADTISHNLGVVPEMIWVKNRDDAGMAARQKWVVYHASVSSGYLNLHDTVALQTSDAASKFGNGSSLVAPTADNFTVADDYDIGRSGYNYIAYLFASLDGISKVGSVTHSGTTNVDCGFSSGASLVMLKRTDSTGDWYWWDSTSGIVSGNDPYFILNGQAAQVTNTDYIDPLSSGFTITSSLTAGDYIFYAIA